MVQIPFLFSECVQDKIPDREQRIEFGRKLFALRFYSPMISHGLEFGIVEEGKVWNPGDSNLQVNLKWMQNLGRLLNFTVEFWNILRSVLEIVKP